ncbi:hypothetical protein, partial [Chryseobacterium gambrini]|uniref:hypothetical protein n=1 Tax=Chryseobacterium gambrini TaxID=373672 RepID=UPI003BA5FC11
SFFFHLFAHSRSFCFLVLGGPPPPPPKPQKELKHAAQSGLKYRSAILTFSVKYLNSGIYYLQHS